jgi:hypothetical protein
MDTPIAKKEIDKKMRILYVAGSPKRRGEIWVSIILCPLRLSLIHLLLFSLFARKIVEKI